MRFIKLDLKDFNSEKLKLAKRILEEVKTLLEREQETYVCVAINRARQTLVRQAVDSVTGLNYVSGTLRSRISEALRKEVGSPVAVTHTRKFELWCLATGRQPVSHNANVYRVLWVKDILKDIEALESAQ